MKSVSQYDGLLLGHGYEYGTIGRGAAGALIYTGNASPNLGGLKQERMNGGPVLLVEVGFVINGINYQW